MDMTANGAGFKEITSIAEEAYIFAYPMLENFRTMERLTGARATPEKRRYFNRFRHSEKLLGADFDRIVAPNTDTLYSSSWLDLAAQPLVLSIPDIADRRYYVFQLVNMYNHNFGYIGARTTGFESKDYLIAYRDWPGEIPPGISGVFRSETRFAFLLGRTLVEGPEDLENVRRLQQDYHLQSLGRYMGIEKADSTEQGPILPVFDAEKAATADFITYLNFILGNASIHPDEAEMVKRFSRIGIRPGGNAFDRQSTDGSVVRAIDEGVGRALEKIRQKVKQMGRSVNGWNSMADSHGPREVMAGRYLDNAAGAMAGLYGNDKEEASNFAGFRDHTGEELDAAKRAYTLRFPPDRLPPVLAFWSLTMYRLPEILLVDNPIDRYAIGDRTKELRYQSDGSLQIFIQHEYPGRDKASNWLPAPAGPFILALRCYLPDPGKFPFYTPPAIRRS
jgi:hypothetical protein